MTKLPTAEDSVLPHNPSSGYGVTRYDDAVHTFHTAEMLFPERVYANPFVRAAIAMCYQDDDIAKATKTQQSGQTPPPLWPASDTQTPPPLSWRRRGNCGSPLPPTRTAIWTRSPRAWSSNAGGWMRRSRSPRRQCGAGRVAAAGAPRTTSSSRYDSSTGSETDS